MRARVPCNVCGRTYTWEEYLDLPAPRLGARQEVDDGVFAEVRNCPCDATMVRLIPDEEPRENPRRVRLPPGDVCDQCGDRDGCERGIDELGIVCPDCWQLFIQDGLVKPFDGGYAFHEDVEEHPLLILRYTDEPLAILFSLRPGDRTSAGTVRVLERGQGAGKLGIKSLIETTYVSRVAALEPPEPWTVAGVYDLPGMFELTQGSGSNDQVWRTILKEVEIHLSDGKWVILVANPVQWAYEVRVFVREAA
jgi:hypothetical protein